jgi:hypothetical protein
VETAPAREPNPEAIAWYLARSERLLDDLRQEVQALLLRASQPAGFSGAVLALAGANAASILTSLHASSRAIAGAALLLAASALIAAFFTALTGTALPKGLEDFSGREAANYLTERFTREPDLWRVQLRTIKALAAAIDATTQQADAVARAVTWAGRFFLTGLVAVGLALGILVAEATFK